MKRFFYVASPGGKVLHIQFGKTHTENPVACGRYSVAGWSWWSRNESSMPVCKQCRP